MNTVLFGGLLCCVLANAPGGSVATQNGVSSLSAMCEAYYVVGSHGKNPRDLGGFASSANFPQPIEEELKSEPKLKPGALSILVRPSGHTRTADAPEPKVEVVIANRTKKRIAFPAQDSALNLRQEAKNASGEWKPIEYMRSSWCGNSYHTVYLGPDECWRVRGDVYSGPFKTTLRYAVVIKNGEHVYSDEFEGSIHEAQFNTPKERPFQLNDENNPKR